jgi:hypothetical protein
MATVIKVEPDSDGETEMLSPQLTPELAEPDEKQGAMSFIFVPVQTEIKVGCFTKVPACAQC